jgi:hypothetical protein
MEGLFLEKLQDVSCGFVVFSNVKIVMVWQRGGTVGSRWCLWNQGVVGSFVGN